VKIKISARETGVYGPTKIKDGKNKHKEKASNRKYTFYITLLMKVHHMLPINHSKVGNITL
jgi:hypothetical protein